MFALTFPLRVIALLRKGVAGLRLLSVVTVLS